MSNEPLDLLSLIMVALLSSAGIIILLYVTFNYKESVKYYDYNQLRKEIRPTLKKIVDVRKGKVQQLKKDCRVPTFDLKNPAESDTARLLRLYESNQGLEEFLKRQDYKLPLKDYFYNPSVKGPYGLILE